MEKNKIKVFTNVFGNRNNEIIKQSSQENYNNQSSCHSPKVNHTSENAVSSTPKDLKINERESAIRQFRDSARKNIMESLLSISYCSSKTSLNTDDSSNDIKTEQSSIYHNELDITIGISPKNHSFIARSSMFRSTENLLNMKLNNACYNNGNYGSRGSGSGSAALKLTKELRGFDNNNNISTIYNKQSNIIAEDNNNENDRENKLKKCSGLSTFLHSTNVTMSSTERIFYEKNDDEWNIEDIDKSNDNNHNIKLIKGNFHEFYEEIKVLGRGSTATVKKCQKILTGEIYAVKISSYKGETERLELCKKEFIGYHGLDHKNIVKVHELLIDISRKKVYTIMELVDGMEMSEYIDKKGPFTEKAAAILFQQLLSALAYLHAKGVCHRDVKPNNILITDDGKTIKLTDFGVSKFVQDKDLIQDYSSFNKENYKMWTQTGTKAFNPPEYFLDTEYTELFDIWGAGVTLYIMLSGMHPFQAEYLDDQIDRIIESKYDLDIGIWINISNECKDMIRSCLQKNYKDRYTPSQALMHSWITKWIIDNEDEYIDSLNVLKLFTKERHSSIRLSLRKNSSIKSEASAKKIENAGSCSKKRQPMFFKDEIPEANQTKERMNARNDCDLVL